MSPFEIAADLGPTFCAPFPGSELETDGFVARFRHDRTEYLHVHDHAEQPPVVDACTPAPSWWFPEVRLPRMGQIGGRW